MVKVKLTTPSPKPVTRPLLETEATAGLLLVQVPPEVGESVVVFPSQMISTPVTNATGTVYTEALVVGSDTQPVAVLVKVKNAVPADTEVTSPELFTVATAGLLLTHVPPDVGDKVVVDPRQMMLEPVKLTSGLSLIVTGKVGSEGQLVPLTVNWNEAVPALIPVTKPVLDTVAVDTSLVDQVPPEDGDNVVV